MNARSTDRLLDAAAALMLAGSWVCLSSGMARQRAYIRLPAALRQQVPAGLDRSALLAALTGMRKPAADWTYVETLQIMVDPRYRGRAVPLLKDSYRQILWLDPYFHFAVKEGASVLGWWYGRTHAATALLEQAMKVDPGYPRYKLYLAALAYSREGKDNKVLDLLRGEVTRPDAPEMLMRILGNIYLRNGDWKDARIYWTWVLGRARHEDTIKAARLGLEEAARHVRGQGLEGR